MFNKIFIISVIMFFGVIATGCASTPKDDTQHVLNPNTGEVFEFKRSCLQEKQQKFNQQIVPRRNKIKENIQKVQGLPPQKVVEVFVALEMLDRQWKVSAMKSCISGNAKKLEEEEVLSKYLEVLEGFEFSITAFEKAGTI